MPHGDARQTGREHRRGGSPPPPSPYAGKAVQHWGRYPSASRDRPSAQPAVVDRPSAAPSPSAPHRRRSPRGTRADAPPYRRQADVSVPPMPSPSPRRADRRVHRKTPAPPLRDPCARVPQSRAACPPPQTQRQRSESYPPTEQGESPPSSALPASPSHPSLHSRQADGQTPPQ